MNTSNFNWPSKGFVRLPQILSVVPVGKSTWWAGVKTGRFPQPIKIGRMTMWKAQDIEHFINFTGVNENERSH